MIPLEKEKEVRALLKTGISGNEVAQFVGVSADAVYSIRKMVETIAELTPAQRRSIKASLDSGVPVGAIEMQMRIPRASINAVRRYYYLHPDRFRKIRLHECPACGAVRGPGKFRTAKRLDEYIIHGMANDTNTVAMYRVIEDVVALGDSGIIINPLFHDLVTNAKAVMEKFNA